MSDISVVINTKNAADTLERTLKSVAWADEIVVMDMESSDQTKEIAQKYTNKVFNHKDVGYVEPARNAAIGKANCEWILVVDADEEIPLFLKEKIQHLINGDATADAYYLARKNLIFDSWMRHAGWWPDYRLRLFKKGSITWPNKIHSEPKVKGKVHELAASEQLAIVHHNYQSISQFLQRLDKYTTHELSSRNLRPIHSGSVVNAFTSDLISRLFFKKGIDGGLHGVSLSFLQAIYEFIIILKKWESEGFPQRDKEQKTTIKALRHLQKELNYWIADWHIKHSKGPILVWWKIRRKLGF